MRNKKSLLALFIFIIVLLSYVFLTTKVGFADSAEYINIAKAMVGISNTHVFAMHEFLYSLYLSSFLFLSKTIYILKIANIIWPIALAILFYFLENKKAFLLLIMSPIIHLTSIHISPLVAVAFFIYLAYFFFKQYEKTNNKLYLLFSGLSFGILMCLRTDLILITLLFSLIFFYKRPLKEFLIFLIFTIPTLAIRFLIDSYFFKVPFYSIVSSVGTVFFNNMKNPLLLSPNWIFIFIIIAPLLFLIHKINYKEYKREIIFLFLILLFYIPNVALYYRAIEQLRLLLVITPILLILLSKIITKKLLIINTILSIIVIIIFVYPNFIYPKENQLVEDLNLAKEEFDIKTAVVAGGAYLYPAIPTNYWDEKGPHYIWSREYGFFVQNKSDTFRNISIKSQPRLDANKIIEFNINAIQSRDPLIYELNEPWFMLNKEEFRYDEDNKRLTIIWPFDIDVDNVEKIKCYQVLCIFKKK